MSILSGLSLFAGGQEIPSKSPMTRLPSGGTFFSLAGKVVEAGERGPVRGAHVTLFDFKGMSVATSTTDSEGSFVFYDLVSGTYSLSVSHAQYAEQTVPLELVGPQRDLRVVLKPRPHIQSSAAGQTLAVWAQNIPPEAKKEYSRAARERKAGHMKECITRLEAAIRLYPQFASAYATLGLVQLELGAQQPAQTAFAEALKIDANLPGALFGAGALANARKHYAEALSYLTRAQLVKPNDWRVNYELGEAYRGEGKLELAEQSYRRAKDLHKEYPRTYLLLINMLALQEKYPEALEAMDEYLKLFPHDSFADPVRQKRKLLREHLRKEGASGKNWLP